MIRNYPGFPHGVSGYELTRRACEQAWMFGAHMVFAQHVAGLERHGDRLAVCLDDGHRVTARAGDRPYLFHHRQVTRHVVRCCMSPGEQVAVPRDELLDGLRGSAGDFLDGGGHAVIPILAM